ncbi:MAG: hypothetical protein R3C26_18165 [Calditrichia bacterium]
MLKNFTEKFPPVSALSYREHLSIEVGITWQIETQHPAGVYGAKRLSNKEQFLKGILFILAIAIILGSAVLQPDAGGGIAGAIPRFSAIPGEGE